MEGRKNQEKNSGKKRKTLEKRTNYIRKDLQSIIGYLPEKILIMPELARD